LVSPSRRVDGIPRSGIREIFDLARGVPGLVHLELGEPDFRLPDHVTEACIQALKDGFTKYTPNAGLEELREAISEKVKRENGFDVDPKTEVMVTAGAMNALSLSVLSTVNEGEEIVIPDPGYVSYVAQVLLAGGVPVHVPLLEKNDFRVTAEDLQKVVTKRTRMIILNSPSNPTGAVEHKEDLKEIADLATDRDILVLSDEPYERLVYPGNKHYSIAALPGMHDRTISIFSFSKTYAMTGMRVGYMIGCQTLIRQMTKLQEHYVSCVNAVAQKGAVAALRGPQECIQDMVTEYMHRRDTLIDGLNATGMITCRKPAGTFYAFPNITRTGHDSKTLAKKILTEAKVVTVPGVAFGNNGEGHIRLCFATDIKNITEAVKRIGSFCEKLPIQAAARPAQR
jgi:aspartate/methionine/tyrosine aminotransferase